MFALEDILSDPLYADGDVLTGVNDDAGKLRAFLMDAYTIYNTKEVLLGGKYPEMPIRYARFDNPIPWHPVPEYERTPPTDLYFGDLNSSWDDNENGIFGEPTEYTDTYCEINIGRIPFTSEDDVNAYIDKLRIYEFNPGLGDRSYLNKAFMTKQYDCFVSGDSLTIDPYPSFTKLFNGSNLICKFEEKGKLKPTGAEVIKAMNSNPCGVHNFIGHGSPCGVALCGKPDVEDPYAINALDNESFYEIEEIGNGLDCLTNKAYPAWSYSMSCTLMPFDTFAEYNVTKNFGESYILGKDYGGVAFFGNTRLSWNISSTKYFQKFFRFLYNIYRISNMAIEGVYAGNLMSNSKSLFDKSAGCEHLIHNLFGDPLVHLWIKEPDEYNYYTTRSDDCSYYITGVPEDRLLVLSTIEFGPKIKAAKSQTTASAFNGSALGINKLYTFYRKDALPLILPLTLQNIQFPEENVYIVAGDVNCGRAIDNSEGCTEGPVIIPWGCELNIESMGDVYLGWGTELQMGGKLTVKADGTVILNNIIIPNYSSLYIEADNIEIGYNVEFNEDASVTLIERNPKQKVASRSAESVDYRPLVEEGKTWWYGYGYPQSTGLLHDEEVSFSIGKEVELDGKKWHKIIQGIGYINDVDLGEHYTNENVCIGYIQEDNGVIYTKHKPIKTITLSENSPTAWGLYTRTYVPSQSFLASPEQVMYDFSLGINDIYYRNKDYRYNVTGYSTLENSGIVYKIQTLEGNGRSLEFIEGIGAKEGDGLFFDHLCIIMIPTLPCYYPPQLRYVTDASGKIIYEGIGGRRLWEDFAGIENVAAEASEANVKWYNLQGIEVAKPESAGVYIRRKGNDSRKVIIR